MHLKPTYNSTNDDTWDIMDPVSGTCVVLGYTLERVKDLISDEAFNETCSIAILNHLTKELPMSQFNEDTTDPILSEDMPPKTVSVIVSEFLNVEEDDPTVAQFILNAVNEKISSYREHNDDDNIVSDDDLPF